MILFLNIVSLLIMYIMAYWVFYFTGDKCKKYAKERFTYMVVSTGIAAIVLAILFTAF